MAPSGVYQFHKPCKIKLRLVRWVCPCQCTPGRESRGGRGVWKWDSFPLMCLYEIKQTAIESLLSRGKGKLTQQPICVYQLAGEKGEAYSLKQASFCTDRDITYNKLGKLVKWDICCTCSSTKALSSYEFPLCILGACDDGLRMSLEGSSLSNKKGSSSLSNLHNNYFTTL